METCAEVYRDRILRGTGPGGNYSSFMLGAIGADLGAIACFFDKPWRRLAVALSKDAQGWLFNEAAFSLRALGRLEEALEPMQVAVDMRVQQEDFQNAAASYINFSQLQLNLGRIELAVADAKRAVDYADLASDPFWRMAAHTSLADAQHQQSDTVTAAQLFAEAEAMQAERQPEYPLLYSLWGFRYCDLLLAGAQGVEGAVWRDGKAQAALLERCAKVGERVAQTLKWVERANIDQLSAALDHLTLARCALYTARLQGCVPGTDTQTEAAKAVAGLRAAGQQQYVPLGLLTRAWLYHCLRKIDDAKADLDEAERITKRGSMKLHLADVALYRARLFQDRAALTEARRLIEECGYGRRIPELKDAEEAALNWPA